jgi:hydroxymethylpyrimidine pyrophosphatase-like HAD family hydrolase
MNNLYVFDVDGVLCDRGSIINPQFKLWFLDWLHSKNFSLLTGSGRQKTIDQIGEDIVQMSSISYHCMGNNIWINNREVSINQFTLHKEEYEFLQNYISQHSFPIKTGHHIDLRKGSINFSIVGRNANQEERKIYNEYDRLYNDRLHFIEKFCKEFPRFEAYLGGDTSVDICLVGCNKSQILEYALPFDNFYFFGDRCYKNGIDYPLSQYLTYRNLDHIKTNMMDFPMIYFQINNGYEETWEILKSL